MQSISAYIKRGVDSTKDLVLELFVSCPTRPYEGLFSTLLFVSAIVILDPTTNIYGNAITYAYIRWLPEAAFGAIILFISLNGLASAISKNVRWRAYSTTGVALVFTTLFVLFFSANSKGMLIPWLGILGVVSFAHAIRLWLIHKDYIYE